jgi:hypothetical protein
MSQHSGAPEAPVKGKESEEQLVQRAQAAISECRWTVGECAALWTKKYSRGRTDADFAALVGLSGDQIYQRRRVWEVFAEEKEKYGSLKWSHFYTALAWDDAAECLAWSDENKSTVAEMKAWRRAVRGEDLSLEAEELALPDSSVNDAIQFVPNEPSYVQDPSEFGGSGRGDGGGRSASGELVETVAGAARELSPGEGYAPFRANAGTVPGKGAPEKDAAPPEPIPPEQMVKRMTSTLERCLKVFTPEFRKEFRKLPEPVKNKLVKVVGELSSTVGNLL